MFDIANLFLAKFHVILKLLIHNIFFHGFLFSLDKLKVVLVFFVEYIFFYFI